METGQKYHGSNGLVRDEFSSPFHWETQSQMETFFIMDKIDIPGIVKNGGLKKRIEKCPDFDININLSLADKKESLKQKTEKNKSFITKLNNQLISSNQTDVKNTQKSKKSKPLPPPRAPTTRRQSNISNFSSSTLSASASTNGMINPAYSD